MTIPAKTMAFHSYNLGADLWRKRIIVQLLRIASFICIVFLINAMLSSLIQSSSSDTVLSRLSSAHKAVNMIPKSRTDWDEQTGSEYGFCDKIFENPKPYHKECKRDSTNLTCTTFKEVLMFSQFKQDYYMYTRHFFNLKRRGTYLDIAANDPVSYSNTFFMDRCLGWSGICVEANPEYFEKIYRRRSCQLVPTCIGKKEGEHVEFGMYGGAGGIQGDSYKHTAKFADKNIHVPTIKERCTTVDTVLKRNNIQVIDYLSLDVEGHELEVLKGVNWDTTTINVMTIEISSGSLTEISDYLSPRGYKRHFPDLDDEKSRKLGLLNEDAIFLHENVEFGNPV